MYLLPPEPTVYSTGSETDVLNTVASVDLDLVQNMIDVQLQFLNTEDTPSADDITNSLRDRKYDISSESKFYFVSCPWFDRIEFVATRLSVDEASSSLRLRAEATDYPLPTDVHHTYTRYFWYRDSFAIVRSSEQIVNRFLSKLGFFRLGFSKLLELTESKRFRFRSENTDLVFVKDFGRELAKTWSIIESDLHRFVKYMDFDFENGRIFLLCEDGIRVIDYV